MRLWLSKNSEVPLRDQLMTQVMLGIVSDDLKAGQKLPSTRELARRFKIHPNTVNSAYRDLAKRGWVEFRKGSGVYVCAPVGETGLDARLELDQLISSFFRIVRGRGFSLGDFQSRIKHWLELQPPDHFLVIEPDDEMRRIIAVEIKDATGLSVVEAGLEECAAPALLAGAAPVAMYGQAVEVRAALPRETECLLLHSRSVPESLQGQMSPPPDSLIAVVSRWPEFLRWSRTILVAVGLDPDAISFRDAREPSWDKGLRACTFIITDTLTARNLPAGCRARIFRIIADSSIAELRNFVAHP